MQDAARFLCCGFDSAHRDDLDALIDRGLGGVVLFSRNITGGPDEVAALTADLKRRAGDRPLYVAVDQEGGRVARLREGFTAVPAMREITSDALAADAGTVLGRELRAVNIDVNFAPVADVDTNPLNPVIGDRSFGRDPSTVGRRAAALLTAMQAEGVAACAKHFPGHGDTSQDSHTSLPTLPHDLARLDRIELPPFRDCVAAGAASVMTAHVLLPALDADVPATLSRRVLTGLLRDRLGYDGVVFSDDLEMAGVAAHHDLGDAAVRTVLAGADVALICHTPARQVAALDALEKAIRDGALSRERLAQSLRRLDALCARFVRPPTGVRPTEAFASAVHQRLRQRVVSGVAEGADPTRYHPL